MKQTTNWWPTQTILLLYYLLGFLCMPILCHVGSIGNFSGIELGCLPCTWNFFKEVVKRNCSNRSRTGHGPQNLNVKSNFTWLYEESFYFTVICRLKNQAILWMDYMYLVCNNSTLTYNSLQLKIELIIMKLIEYGCPFIYRIRNN